MRVVVHAGMHKTGSTSIQHSFHAAAGNGYDYLCHDDPNLSIALIHAFAPLDVIERSPFVLRKNQTPERRLAEREEIREHLADQLRTCKQPVMVVSAEALSAQIRDLQRNVLEFLAEFTDEIEGVAYIRPPVSFMESAFQERLKNRLVPLSARGLWPRYPARFRTLIEILKRKRMHFIKFDRAELRDGDVVADFAHRIGVPVPQTPHGHHNESRPAEAICLLYHYRRFVEGEVITDPRAYQADWRLGQELGKIGSSRFRLSRSFGAEGEAAFAHHRPWMERHLGCSLAEEREDGPGFFGSEDDILAGAEAARPALQAHMTSLGLATGHDLSDDLARLQAWCLDRTQTPGQPVSALKRLAQSRR